ncbi:BTAD domain-containing putative transcriptional regulator [Virgisporangium aurantiacum]|uniref:SARP family transcriptional regulator n=1 Tax=Virgisporangium aurantiacum TaxID=175570 RepID=A0A8J3Z208_9ACTN|nr:BTAD domain-containing putative transcriptional regulator [Virgisporangium aurantiacum]GIJ55981.1 SARP family transcriptional regulator [Virgisporangium aurantiacum]
MEFRILGPVQVWRDGSPISLGGPRHRRLLAVLLVHADAVVPGDVLIDALWPAGAPRRARDVLHVRVSELRAALRVDNDERDAGLAHREGGYRLRVNADELDARVFERLAAAGGRALAAGEVERARGLLGEALAVYRGPALAEFADEAFARPTATRLDAVRLQALEHRVAADLDSGRHDLVLPELATLTAEYPLRERFRAQLMLALYRAGRQSEALAAYREVARLLRVELGIEPGAELRELEAAVLRQDPALGAGAHGVSEKTTDQGDGNLPAGLTGFVGRGRDLAGVAERLRAGRLVTLTGVGGVGKSRLAVEAAAVAGGAWLVDLAALTQPGLVVLTIAATLGVREHPRRPTLDVLAARLDRAPALLVLDNCDHLVAEVAGATDALLKACPPLRIIATSRERLGVTGEQLWPVAGLEPADARRLLTDRVTAGRPRFRPTAALDGICRRLDGLPLALELAAASIQVLGVEEVARGLSDRFRLLTRGSRTALPRHRTLRAIVDWSYERLSPADRRLFERLSVFVGGFTLSSAEAVAGEGVVGLVDKSMVTFDGSRYRMLETLRAYGSERLDESGLRDETRDRHAATVLALVKAARAAWQSDGQTVWLRRLEEENGNLRAALHWCLATGDAATALRLAGSLYPLWDRHGRYREGRRWLSAALALDKPVPPIVRARALDSAAGLAVLQGDLAAAGRAADEAAELSRQAGDGAGVARALTTLGLAAIYGGDYPRAASVLQRALGYARESGAVWPEAFALLYLASVAAARNDDELALALADECAPVMRAMGDPEALAALDMLRGTLAWRAGDSSAAAYLRASLRGYGQLGHVWGLSLGLYLAAELAAGRGGHDRAVSLLATSAALRDAIGVVVLPFVGAWIDELLARSRAILDPAAFDAAWAAGLSRRPEAALELALEEAG